MKERARLEWKRDSEKENMEERQSARERAIESESKIERQSEGMGIVTLIAGIFNRTAVPYRGRLHRGIEITVHRGLI